MIKKTLISALLMGFVILAAAPANSAVYTMVPTPANMWGLDHNYFYTWGIQWNHPGERITDAILTFHDIYDWRIEYGDVLFSHLLDNPPVGTIAGYEGFTNDDYFAGQGTFIGMWSDPGGGVPRDFNLSYRFSDLGLVNTLNDYAADGLFGFGFDPDCHYFNQGVELTVVTAVPEPTTIFLLGMGLVSGGIFYRRKK